jgi:hypothetical protein
MYDEATSDRRNRRTFPVRCIRTVLGVLVVLGFFLHNHVQLARDGQVRQRT